MQQQIQKIERKQSCAGRYWTLSMIVLFGAISIAYLYPAMSPESVAAIIETTNSHSSRIEEIHNWIKKTMDTINSLSSEFGKISHDHNLMKKELKESISSLSSEVESVRHDHHLTEKELKQAMKNITSTEKRLRESVDRLSSEVEKISQSQQIMEEGLKKSSIKVAKFSDKII
jgi:TolA-binding protein